MKVDGGFVTLEIRRRNWKKSPHWLYICLGERMVGMVWSKSACLRALTLPGNGKNGKSYFLRVGNFDGFWNVDEIKVRDRKGGEGDDRA